MGMPEDTAFFAEFRKVTASVRFIQVEPAAKHVDALASEKTDLSGFATIRLAEVMRPTSVTRESAQYGIIDLPTRKTGMFLDVSVLDLPATDPFPKRRDTYGAMLQKKVGFEKAFEWHDQKGLPALQISQVQPVTANGQKYLYLLCLLDVGDGKIVQLLFTVFDRNAEDTKAYLAVIDRMLASVTPKPTATRP